MALSAYNGFTVVQKMEIGKYKFTTDTLPEYIPIRRKSLDTAISIIEEWRFMKLELVAKDSAIQQLARQVQDWNDSYESQQTSYEGLIVNYDKQIKLLTHQRDIANGNVTQYQKEIRRQKTGKWLIGAGGIAAVLLTVLIIK